MPIFPFHQKVFLCVYLCVFVLLLEIHTPFSFMVFKLWYLWYLNLLFCNYYILPLYL